MPHDATALVIRRAGRADLDDILALLGHLHDKDLPAPSREVLAEVFGRMLDNPILHCLVAGRGGRAEATCLLAVIPNLTRSARPFGIIENVVVLPGARGRGVGSALVRAALDAAWERGCYKVMIQTDAWRPGVDAFYQRLGFVKGEKNGLVARPPATT